eukprot:RCo052665
MSDLNFLRYDLMTISSTARNCLRILPLGKKNKQKVVVGDSSGFVQGFSLGRAQELITSFKLNPLPPGQPAKPVNGLDLVGDKVFVSNGETISGMSKKGKNFFRLVTNLTEPLCNMAVRSPFIWTAGEYVLNVFEEGRESAFYMCPDRINHLTVEHIVSDKTMDSVLACNDRMVRVVHGGDMSGESPVEGSTSTVAIYTTRNSTAKEVLYGTQSGHLGCFRITPQGLQKRWAAYDAQFTGGFNSITSWDLVKDGTSQIISGRDNGFLEVFAFGTAGPEPHLLYQTTLNESITAVDIGLVTTAVKEDIAVSTYSGKVLSFSTYSPGASGTEPSPSFSGSGSASGSQTLREDGTTARRKNEKRLAAIQQEIEKLKERLDKKKTEYSRVSEDHIAVSVDYKLKDKFILDASATWILTIELDCPIDVVALQCDVDVELLDVDNSSAIISRTKPEKDCPSKLLASYRNTESTNRVEIRIRSVEGQSGTLQAFVIPTLTPKTAQMASYQIRPLSLHQRLTEKPQGLDELVVNTLTIEGKFSLSEMNSWLGQCLPDVPERTTGEEVTHYFRNTFQGTVLVARYRDREVSLRSDNISTLAVLKDHLMRQATARKIQIKANFDLKDETCGSVLAMLHPKLQHQLGLSEKVKLIEALKEVEMQEQDISFLSEQYKEILSKAKEIEKEFEMQPRRLEYLYSLVKNLFLDKYKFKGQNVSHKLPVLQGHLEKYDLDNLQAFFAQN